ncbi:DUF429 domain-containing protein [Candidatus Litorirhabdus singularis]|uniref:DUF429 domain-containing protein n=1 Tax=Candidatus Litorirhabdus singularis TaxID=2518993 RepID=UPI00242A6485|nr:DUF429 domain-containing protein [Candidatus Litorirhabdus singularis]
MIENCEMKTLYVGIDLAIAKKKYLPICLCSWDGERLLPVDLTQLTCRPPRGRGNLAVLDAELVKRFVDEAATYLQAVATKLGGRIVRIGIDAPRSPRVENQKRRAAEVAMDQAGISCFTTPSASEFEMIFGKVRRHIANGGEESRLPHANQLWMQVGFRLFERLSSIAPCIEVFPQATVRAIGSGAIHKSQAGVVESQLSTAAQYTGWPAGGGREVVLGQIGFGSNHDLLDAYLSAWVAALPESERRAMGVPPEDVVWVPRVGEPAFERPKVINKPIRAVGSQDTPRASDGLQRLCPGCGQHQFKRWPFGWDVHAAHRCVGLKSTDPIARKAEYRGLYAHLFPGRKK